MLYLEKKSKALRYLNVFLDDIVRNLRPTKRERRFGGEALLPFVLKKRKRRNWVKKQPRVLLWTMLN
jgi:hypothetical protein